MITVIIAGGSGTRLWPLSTSSNPKQLLALTGNRTMVQATYDRAKLLGESVYVITEQSHSDALKQQLSDLNDDAFIVEPGRRNTASCVIAALHHIQSRHDKDEPIAFMSADHYIRDTRGFELSFRRAAEVSQKYNCEVLVGIEPTYAATVYGYIEKGEEVDGGMAHAVASFKEKPDLATANGFIASGNYLWNAGYFVGSVNAFLREMKEYAPELAERYDALIATTSEEEYEATYLSFANEPIDTALNEKVDDMMVVPASFDWTDVGNFRDLDEVAAKNEEGNHVKGENVHTIELENSYIRNDESGKPIAVIGLDNIVVINSPNGLLVARKDLSQKVGEIAKKVQE